MLVLSRREGESIQIGPDITIRVVKIHDRWGQVRLGITAPDTVNIRRAELVEPEEEVDNEKETHGRNG